jgi:hypothetical protein
MRWRIWCVRSMNTKLLVGMRFNSRRGEFAVSVMHGIGG